MKNILNTLILLIPFLVISQNNVDKCIDEKTYENDNYVGCINDEGNPDGFGIMNYENQDVYEGYWKNGKRNGLGKFESTGGYFYEGNWENGLKKGEGISTEKKDSKIYTRKGIFKNDQLIEGTKVVDNGYFLTSFVVTYKSYIGIVNKEIDLLSGPGSGFEIIKNLIPGNQLFIISDKPINDYYNVIDIVSNEEGYVHKSSIELANEVEINEVNDLFKFAGKSESLTSSRIEAINSSEKPMTLIFGGSTWLFAPKGKWFINVSPGNYKIIVSSPNVIPYIEKVEIESGKNYKREYVIIEVEK
ncbi:MAG: hypothetical protein ACKVIV_04935 [Flavobacteriales bacterium]|jgi:hypothetical protein|tara:strand:+ start:2984 stop:3889 length:906 start_codon:yes stop_codon:yes gene_type:complete